MQLYINLKLSLNLKYNRLNRSLADLHINRNITLNEKICTRRKTRAFTMERRTMKKHKQNVQKSITPITSSLLVVKILILMSF